MNPKLEKLFKKYTEPHIIHNRFLQLLKEVDTEEMKDIVCDYMGDRQIDRLEWLQILGEVELRGYESGMGEMYLIINLLKNIYVG